VFKRYRIRAASVSAASSITTRPSPLGPGPPHATPEVPRTRTKRECPSHSAPKHFEALRCVALGARQIVRGGMLRYGEKNPSNSVK
jgi:hypothetical protein